MNNNRLHTLGIIGLIALMILTSCSNEDQYLFSNDENTPTPDILLQERSNGIPTAIKLPMKAKQGVKTRGINSDGELIGNSDILLGYSYSVGNSFMGSMENVKFPVLDLEKIKGKYSTAITRKQLNSSSEESFSYNGMSRYESNSQVSKTVKTGFSLNLGLFKIGREEKLTELFKSSFSSNANCVCGELNLEIINGQYELLATADKRKIYARECLTPTFQTDLYRGTIGNLIDTYGHFVLRSYITGGKAMALYVGESAKYNDFQSREKGLNKDINASFSWKSNSASGNLSFGKNDGSSTTQEYETQNTKVYIKTFGGSPLYQAAVGPRDLNTLSVDLSAWLNSLNDKSTNTLIDITSGLKEEECGLYPMSDFVLEKNFRYRMDDTTLGLLESLTDVVDPRFEIVKVLARISSTGEKLYEVAAVLNTRQGDKIVLSDGTYKNAPDSELRANNSNQTMMNRVQEIFAQKKTVFQGLEFSTNYSTTYNPDVRKPLCIRLDGFDENKMAFYADPKSNMRYIYDSSKKIAFAYNEDEEYGDYVLDYYGIRDWVESLPKRSTSMMILQNYTIIGL